jgi:DNA-binding MarR family transcriptional regulator
MDDRLFGDDLPELPYNGTSGWSGSEASKERAIRNNNDGTTALRQRQVISLLRTNGARGLTWKEAGQALKMHHGTVSGALSVLHRRGHVSRLTERRDRSSVYVCNEFVSGRETSEHKPNASARLLVDVLNALAADIESGNLNQAKHRIRKTLETFKEGTK